MKYNIEALVKLAEDLVNTYDTFLEQPEGLRTPQELADFVKQHGIQPDRSLVETDLQEVYGLRDQLRKVYATPDSEESTGMLNVLLEDVKLKPVLIQEEQSWSVQLEAELAVPLLQRLRTEAALGLSYALEYYGKSRLRVCVAAPCQDVFVDVSRNGTRRFCCERCANRYNVAAFRARQKE